MDGSDPRCLLWGTLWTPEDPVDCLLCTHSLVHEMIWIIPVYRGKSTENTSAKQSNPSHVNQHLRHLQENRDMMSPSFL